jgi:hypothetical protein
MIGEDTLTEKLLPTAVAFELTNGPVKAAILA